MLSESQTENKFLLWSVQSKYGSSDPALAVSPAGLCLSWRTKCKYFHLLPRHTCVFTMNTLKTFQGVTVWFLKYLCEQCESEKIFYVMFDQRFIQYTWTFHHMIYLKAVNRSHLKHMHKHYPELFIIQLFILLLWNVCSYMCEQCTSGPADISWGVLEIY